MDGDDDASGFLAGGQVADAVDERRSRRRLRAQAEEAADLAGALADLGEQSVGVRVRTRAGNAYQGTVVAVGADYATVRTAAGDVHVALTAVTTVRPRPAESATAPARAGAVERGVTLGGLLAEAAEDRPTLTLVVDGFETVTGRLEAVGRDVLTVLTERSQRCHVAVHAVVECSFADAALPR